MESHLYAEAEEQSSNVRKMRRVTKTWQIGKKSSAERDAWIDNEIRVAYQIYRDRCTPIFSHIKNLRRRVTNTTNGDELEAREEISDNSTTPPSTSTSARQPHIGDDSMEQIPTEGPPEIDDAEMNLITSVFERNASKMRKTSGTQNWMKTRTARWIALHESPGAN